jgi:hypothetical protein
MKLKIIIVVSFLYSSSVIAEEIRIQQTDPLGNIQYQKPSYSVRDDGRVIETDSVGNKQYDKQQYHIKGDKRLIQLIQREISNITKRSK